MNKILICIVFMALGLGVAGFSGTELEMTQKAARQGDVDAQFNLGNMYYNGEGVKQDITLAVQWFEKAAEQGHTQAQESLDKLRRGLSL